MAKITANGAHEVGRAKSEADPGARFVLRSDGAILAAFHKDDGLRVWARIKAQIVEEGEGAMFLAFASWCDRRDLHARWTSTANLDTAIEEVPWGGGR